MISNNFGRKYQCWLGLSARHSKSCPNKRYFGTVMHYKLRSCSVSQWQYNIIFWKETASVQCPVITGRVGYATRGELFYISNWRKSLKVRECIIYWGIKQDMMTNGWEAGCLVHHSFAMELGFSKIVVEDFKGVH